MRAFITTLVVLALCPALSAQDVPRAKLASGVWGVLWSCPPTYKVRPDTPPPSKTQKAVEIMAAGNEFEPFQLVLRPVRTLANVKVTPRSFTGPKGARIPAWAVTVRNVEYVMLTDNAGRQVLYPDPLPAHTPFAAPAQRNSVVWVTPYVPPRTPPGAYYSKVDIEAQGLRKIEVAVRLHIWGFELPSVSKLRTSLGCDMAHVCEFQGARELEQKRKLLELYNADFWRHRVSPSDPFFTYDVKVTETESGPRFDFADFDIAIEKYTPLFNSFSLPGFVKALKSGQRDPEQDNRKAEYMRAVVERLADKGQISKGFNWICDDPQPQELPAVIDASRVCRGADGRIKVLVNAQVEPKLFEWVDIWAPRVDVYEEEKSKARQAAGQEVWWYLDCEVRHPYPNFFVEHAAVDHRVVPWLAWRFGVNGILYAETARWQKNPWEETSACRSETAGGYGDGMLLYPPVRKASDKFVAKGPVPSMRWELIREGIEDYDYFALLSELTSKLRTSDPGSRAIIQAQDALAGVNSCVASRTDYTRDLIQMEAARRKVARMIEIVSRAIAAKAKKN